MEEERIMRRHGFCEDKKEKGDKRAERIGQEQKKNGGKGRQEKQVSGKKMKKEG